MLQHHIHIKYKDPESFSHFFCDNQTLLIFVLVIAHMFASLLMSAVYLGDHQCEYLKKVMLNLTNLPRYLF